jgi:hypothetical protein
MYIYSTLDFNSFNILFLSHKERPAIWTGGRNNSFSLHCTEVLYKKSSKECFLGLNNDNEK